MTNVSGYGIYALATIYADKVLPGNVVVYNNLTPNGDGINDVFIIVGIEEHPDNVVLIFNRWGNKVSEIKGYNNKEKAFRGFANVGLTLNNSEVLPSGTYYYILTYTVNGELVRTLKYLYINGK
jgi:gliding motility-associated-like protein